MFYHASSNTGTRDKLFINFYQQLLLLMVLILQQNKCQVIHSEPAVDLLKDPHQALDSTPDDPYQVLGLTPEASPKAVRRAYIKLAFQYHPDRPGGCLIRFQAINEAYQKIVTIVEQKQNKDNRLLIRASDLLAIEGSVDGNPSNEKTSLQARVLSYLIMFPYFRSDHTSFNEAGEPAFFTSRTFFRSDETIYYHSTGGCDPFKLSSILRCGILSKNAAAEEGLVIDSSGLGCNKSEFVSVATEFCGCMSGSDGSFHFVIDRELVESIRCNPYQNMPLERQVFNKIPREAIKGIQLGQEGFLDLTEPCIKLGLGWGCNSKRATSRVESYYQFMIDEFNHRISDFEKRSISEALSTMTDIDQTEDFITREKLAKPLIEKIELILKTHLKRCYSKAIKQDLISPFDIVRFYDKSIPVFDHQGKEVAISKSPNPRGFAEEAGDNPSSVSFDY